MRRKNPLIINILKDNFKYKNFINGFLLTDIIEKIDNNNKYKDGKKMKKNIK